MAGRTGGRSAFPPPMPHSSRLCPDRRGRDDARGSRLDPLFSAPPLLRRHGSSWRTSRGGLFSPCRPGAYFDRQPNLTALHVRTASCRRRKPAKTQTFQPTMAAASPHPDTGPQPSSDYPSPVSSPPPDFQGRPIGASAKQPLRPCRRLFMPGAWRTARRFRAYAEASHEFGRVPWQGPPQDGERANVTDPHDPTRSHRVLVGV